MTHAPFQHPADRQFPLNHAVPPTKSHGSPFPSAPAQSFVHAPLPDPFHANRDPFLSGAERRSSLGLSSWPPSQGTSSHQLQHPQQQLLHQHHQHIPSHNHSLPPLPPNVTPMASPYDPTRRRSLGAAASPQQYLAAPLEPPPPPPSFPARNMPPPSPPQNAPPSHHLGSAPRGPPNASPFPSVRDLTSHRSGMSISAILGGNDEGKPNESPQNSHVAPFSTSKPMQPPSPARARSSSMRESSERNKMKGPSPPRMGTFGELARTASEARRDEIFGSPQFRREPGHGFRVWQGPSQEQVHHIGGNGAPLRPNSQPMEGAGLRGAEDWSRREGPLDTRPVIFRSFGEPQVPQRSDISSRLERPPLQNGVTSHSQDRPIYSSPKMDHDPRAAGPARFLHSTNAGPPLREEASSTLRTRGFAPTSIPAPDTRRELIESKAQDIHRQASQPLPSKNETGALERGRTGHPAPPDEHQRVELLNREPHHKESEGSVHRALLNISPELSRKGRNSPLPQAVQGAQPRHIGPAGDNPGIKMEFGRMFSGLGSGVGSTPHPHHAVNGANTPSRMSPARHLESGDLVRAAVAELDGKRDGLKTNRRNGRRARDEGERLESDGRHTPDLQHGSKRAKMMHPTHRHHHVHPHHHHHHHHHETQETGTTSHNMTRYPSNPIPQVNLATNQTHHHHHHHAHPGHHHHHTPRFMPLPRKSSVTVISKKVLEAVAGKPRKHLGSQLYSTEVFLPSPVDAPCEVRRKFSSKMMPVPVFGGKENCTFTVRVPRYFLAPSNTEAGEHQSFEEICKRRQLWGTEIYTDDTDVVAAAVHSGWLKGDFGVHNDDLHEICGITSEQNGDEKALATLDAQPRSPVKVPEGHDAHITVLILPPLESYASTNQHHICSREWNTAHDGMSFMIHKIEFVDEGGTNRYMERGAAARKKRIAAEEASRREAAAGLLMIATGKGTVSVGA